MFKAFWAHRMCCVCAPSVIHMYGQHSRRMSDFLCTLHKAKVITKLRWYKATVVIVVSGLITTDTNELGYLDSSVCDKPILIMGPSVPANWCNSWLGGMKSIQKRRVKYVFCSAFSPKLRRFTVMKSCDSSWLPLGNILLNFIFLVKLMKFWGIYCISGKTSVFLLLLYNINTDYTFSG